MTEDKEWYDYLEWAGTLKEVESYGDEDDEYDEYQDDDDEDASASTG